MTGTEEPTASTLEKPPTRVFAPDGLARMILVIVGLVVTVSAASFGANSAWSMAHALSSDAWPLTETGRHYGLVLGVGTAGVLAVAGRGQLALAGSVVLAWTSLAVLGVADSLAPRIIEGGWLAWGMFTLTLSSTMMKVAAITVAFTALRLRSGWGALLGAAVFLGWTFPTVAWHAVSIAMDLAGAEWGSLTTHTHAAWTMAGSLGIATLAAAGTLLAARLLPRPGRITSASVVDGAMFPMLGALCAGVVALPVWAMTSGATRVALDRMSQSPLLFSTWDSVFFLIAAVAICALLLGLVLLGLLGERLRWPVPAALVPVSLLALLAGCAFLIVVGVLPEGVLRAIDIAGTSLQVILLATLASLWAGRAWERMYGPGVALSLAIPWLFGQGLADHLFQVGPFTEASAHVWSLSGLIAVVVVCTVGLGLGVGLWPRVRSAVGGR